MQKAALISSTFGRFTDGLPAAGTATAAAATTHVDPWEPVDEQFRGCEGGCGARASGEEPGVLVQATSPVAAKLGDRVYCPVSGVTFEVKDTSPKLELDGKTIFFCCSGCEEYFTKNRERIIRLRGLSTATSRR